MQSSWLGGSAKSLQKEWRMKLRVGMAQIVADLGSA